MISKKPWSPDDVAKFLIVLFGFSTVGLIVNQILAGIGHASHDGLPPFISFLVGTITFHGVALVLIVELFYRYSIPLNSMLKFEFPHLIKALALAGGLAIIVIPITIALAQVCSEVLEKLSLNSEPQTLVKMIQEKKVYSIWQKHVFIFTVLIIAPIIEETVFRGIIYSTIKQMGFPKLALFGTSFLFAIVHGNLMILIPLTFLAITLSWLYELTDNLIAPIFMHALFNGVNLYFLMNNSS